MIEPVTSGPETSALKLHHTATTLSFCRQEAHFNLFQHVDFITYVQYQVKILPIICKTCKKARSLQNLSKYWCPYATVSNPTISVVNV